MIVICGSVADQVTELVCARLMACGYAYRLLDLSVYPCGFEVSWHWRGAVPTGYIAGSSWRTDLVEITGVYARSPCPSWRSLSRDMPGEFARALYAECDIGLTTLLENLPCTVVNRFSGSMSNYSKTYQALLVRSCGLLTPPTLVSNDPLEVQRFIEECNGEVVYKSLSGIRSIVQRVGSRQLARLPLLRHGPAQFQRFIPGENIRVHTVGDELFATLIRSESIDYRFAAKYGQSVEMEPTTLPPRVAAACRRLSRKLGLVLAGIDLKRTPAGEYYCFEANPCPGFLYYEQGTGQPISTALAELLHRGDPIDFPPLSIVPACGPGQDDHRTLHAERNDDL